MTEVTTTGQETPADVSIQVVGAAGDHAGGQTPLEVVLVDRSPNPDRSGFPVTTRPVTVTGPEGSQEITLYLRDWVPGQTEPAVYTSHGRNSLDGFWHPSTRSELFLGLGTGEPDRREPVEFDDGDTITFSAEGAAPASIVGFEKHTDFVLWSQERLLTNARSMFSALLAQYEAAGDRSDEHYRSNVRTLGEAVATCDQGLANHRNPDLWPAGQIKQTSVYIGALPLATLEDFMQGGQLKSTFTGANVLIRGHGTHLPGQGPLVGFGSNWEMSFSRTFDNLGAIAEHRGRQASRAISNEALSTYSLEFLKGAYNYVVDKSGIKWVVPLLNDGKDHNGKALTPGDWVVLAVDVTLKATKVGKKALGSRYTPTGPGGAAAAGIRNLNPIADLEGRAIETAIAGPFRSAANKALKAVYDEVGKPLTAGASHKPVVTSQATPLQAAVDPDSIPMSAELQSATSGEVAGEDVQYVEDPGYLLDDGELDEAGIVDAEASVAGRPRKRVWATVAAAASVATAVGIGGVVLTSGDESSSDDQQIEIADAEADGSGGADDAAAGGGGGGETQQDVPDEPEEGSGGGDGQTSSVSGDVAAITGLLGEGSNLSSEGDYEAAIEHFDSVIETYEDSDDPEVIVAVLQAWSGRAFALQQLGRTDEAVDSALEAELRHGDNADLAVLRRMAFTMSLWAMDPSIEPSLAAEIQQRQIDRYGAIIAQTSDVSAPSAAVDLAETMASRASLLGQIGRSDEAAAGYMEVVETLGHREEPIVRAEVAHALYSLVLLHASTDPDGASEAFADLIDRFGEDEDESVRQWVDFARGFVDSAQLPGG